MNWSKMRSAALGDRPQSPIPPEVKLPVLPGALTEFIRKAEDPHVSPAALAAVIETDAGLTLDLLKHINSSACGVRQKVASVQQAMSLLGIPGTKLHLSTTAVRHALNARQSKLIHFRTFWGTNLERALFARHVAELLGADADLAFAGGMLQDFLLPVLTSEMLNFYVRFVDAQDRKPTDLHLFERKRLGWDHGQAAAHVMFAWGFPDDLICCVLHHHRGLEILEDPALAQTAAAATAIAGLMPDPFRQAPGGLEELMRLEAAWPAFDLPAIAREVQRQFQEMSPGGPGGRISLLRRCENALLGKEA
ncbi:MAG: HDOD domain-containing protein [Planctomycetales bacterium]